MKYPTHVLVIGLLIAFSLPTVIGQDSAGRTPNESLFRLLDNNQDGNLDPYEAFDVLLRLEAEFKERAITTERISVVLKEADRNETNEVTELLTEWDANEDGLTNVDEVEEEMREFAEWVDQNKDGFLSINEVRQANIEDQMFLTDDEILDEVERVFRDFDVNKDGEITKNETQEKEFLWSDLCEADSNQDGKITKPETTANLKSDNQKAKFEIVGNVAVMSGVICTDTPARVLRLVYEHPAVRTIEMANVPGSIDDEANLRAARMVRHFAFATTLGSNGRVASGGTDFFLAGKTRTYESGAKFGIHSWGGSGIQGGDLPRDDPQHQLYLNYYKEMGTAAEFYWRTLEAAPANGIHWMTDQELEEYQFQTTIPASRRETEKD